LHPVVTTLCGRVRQLVVSIMIRRVFAGVIVIAVFCVESGSLFRLNVAL